MKAADHRGAYMIDAAIQMFRFVDSDVQFSTRARSMVLRAVESNTCDARRAWFEAVRSCRRRMHVQDLGETSVHSIFEVQDSYRLLRMRAIFSKIRLRIAHYGMAPFDAFRAMDVDRDGRLSRYVSMFGVSWFVVSRLWVFSPLFYHTSGEGQDL